MTIEYFSTLATAVTSIVAIVLAIATYWHQTRQSNIHLGISILRDCEKDFFYSEEFRRQRLVTAEFLLRRKPEDEPPPEAYELLDFFGSLGGHVKSGVVPTQMAFYTFYFWFSIYFHCLRADINKLHKRHGIAYLEHCEFLYEKTTSYAERRFHLPPDSERFSHERVSEFLAEEVSSLQHWVHG